MSAYKLGEQAAGQAAAIGKKAGGRLARKTARKAVHFIKKLVITLIKKMIVAAIKSILATIGPYIVIVFVALLLFSAVIASIPKADWFLRGGERTDKEELADHQYEQSFKYLANESVLPIDREEAGETWKETLKNIVKPSWGIPASLARYQLVRSDSHMQLPDPKELFANLKPSFSYANVTDDTLYTKTITTCFHEEPVQDEEGNEMKDENGNTVTRRIEEPPTETVSSSKMPTRSILAKVEIPFGSTVIPSAKRYYPGGTYEPNNTWESGGSSTSGNCTITKFSRWEKTMVDDRGVPQMEFDANKFKAYLVSSGVKENSIDEIFEYIKASDAEFPAELYRGTYSQGGGEYSNADYKYTGGTVDGWVWPIAIDYYGINSGFGPRWGAFHYGVDLGGRAWPNAPILAAKAGLVIWAGQLSTYGNLVVINHEDGLQTRYAHMSSVTVKVGEQVTAGQQIGKQGATGDVTGPHLHFEVAIPNPRNPMSKMSEAEKAFDPMIFLGPVLEKIRNGGR